MGEGVALVTGASSGIGRAVAVRLRRGGWHVMAIGRSEAALRDLADECGAETFSLDVGDTRALARMVDGRTIDVVVHSAGILSTRDLFFLMDPREIDAMVGTNLLAPLHLTRLVLPAMVGRRRGHVVFIGSSAGRWPHPNAAVYGASKAGVSLFCDALRCDLLGTGVRVTEVAPGRVVSQLYRTALGKEAQDELYEGYASVRPDDIAELIAVALAMPPNVDVSRLEVFPTDQAVGGARIVKSEGVAGSSGSPAES